MQAESLEFKGGIFLSKVTDLIKAAFPEQLAKTHFHEGDLP